MSDDNELNNFRTKWLNELRTTKQPVLEGHPSNQHVRTTESNERLLSNDSATSGFVFDNRTSEESTTGSVINENNGIIQNNKNNDRGAEYSNKQKMTSSLTYDDKVDDYEAFKIANKYLNISDSQNCKHCYSKNPDANLDSPNVVARYSKRKRDCCVGKSSNKKMMFDHGGECSSSSSLLDLLIADIDEITTVPFFDNELPKEIAVKIFRHLSLVDLARCSLVSKQWQKIAEDDFIWFKIYKRFCDVGNDGNSERQQLVLGDQQNWKKFVKNVFLEKRAIRKKWRERLCEVRNFENEKGMKTS